MRSQKARTRWRAGERQTLGYRELIVAAEVSHADNDLGRYLDRIASDCIAQKLPPLDVLVINQRTQRPGRKISDPEWEIAVTKIYDEAAYRD